MTDPPIQWESHEGMVTVYREDGTYAGCMGAERWERLLRADEVSRVTDDEPGFGKETHWTYEPLPEEIEVSRVSDPAAHTPSDPAGAPDMDTQAIKDALRLLAKWMEAEQIGEPSVRETLRRAYTALSNLVARARQGEIRVEASTLPWSFHRGTLRERLEWCRIQHQLAAENPPLHPPTREAKADFDRACVEWYREMVEQLDAIEAERHALAEEIADDGLGERLVNGVLFSDRVKQWLVSNQKSAEDVLHGQFPLGMVATWINRAEAAEVDRDRLDRRVAELEQELAETKGEAEKALNNAAIFIADWRNGVAELEAALKELSICVLHGWTSPAFVRGKLHNRAVELAHAALAGDGGRP